MTVTSFTFNDLKSTDFNMYINAEYEIASSASDYQIVEVPGRDGDLIIPNNRYKSFVQELPIIYLGKHKETMQKIDQARQIMLADSKWHDFLFSFDRDYIYRAAYLSSFPVKKTVTGITQTLQFEMMPYKYLTSGQSYQTITNKQVLTNPGTISAKPIIKVTGEGDCTIQIGSAKVSLKGIDTGIIMDTDSQSCTNLAGTRTAFDKMYGDFMSIAKGNQTVTITGDNITKIELLPRWAVRS
ncbi:hypothetical protein LFYK43_14420 [Ligilactobacillus salitolerans]|uniref:Phage protein n=1 Tax=Ligilactobacillus salitolerans TaxID=1808352 RepID=A0A401ITU8_9LACO|nr:hypothetical protein [Ligilactobacillus salitolerans]GBG94983.1 hypothetical protein LFYK43_14420 [Ligilactobacillus salitolerans]